MSNVWKKYRILSFRNWRLQTNRTENNADLTSWHHVQRTLLEDPRSQVPSPKCTICHKTFKTNRYLAQHYRIHTGESKRECSSCGKIFASRGALCVHRQNKHKNKENSGLNSKKYWNTSVLHSMDFLTLNLHFLSKSCNTMLQVSLNLNPDTTLLFLAIYSNTLAKAMIIIWSIHFNERSDAKKNWSKIYWKIWYW